MLWLVTQSRPSKLYPNGFWRLPKGWIDNEAEDVPGPLAKGDRKATEQELQGAALREVKEEAGVKAHVVEKIGTERYFLTIEGKRILKFVIFFLMQWVADIPAGPGWETSKILWLPFDQAKDKLSHKGEKGFLNKAKEILERPKQESLI